MASMLLRKAWRTVSNRPSFNSDGGGRGRGGAGGGVSGSFNDRGRDSLLLLSRASTGLFDQIPDEILMLILKALGPKETAKLTVVCKTWKMIIAENANLWIYFLQSDPHMPWDSIFFAETHLRYGFPFQVTYNQTPQLSFMDIYGLRAQVPGSIIIDGGSGYCKFGWSKYSCPSGRSATFLEFGNIEAPMYSRLRHFYATIYSRYRIS